MWNRQRSGDNNNKSRSTIRSTCFIDRRCTNSISSFSTRIISSNIPEKALTWQCNNRDRPLFVIRSRCFSVDFSRNNRVRCVGRSGVREDGWSSRVYPRGALSPANTFFYSVHLKSMFHDKIGNILIMLRRWDISWNQLQKWKRRINPSFIYFLFIYYTEIALIIVYLFVENLRMIYFLKFLFYLGVRQLLVIYPHKYIL